MTATGLIVTAFFFGLLFRLAMFVQFLAGLDWIQSIGHQRFTITLSGRGQAHLEGSCTRLLSIPCTLRPRQATRHPPPAGLT